MVLTLNRSSRINYQKLNVQKDFVEVVGRFIKAHSFEDLSIVGHSLGGWLGVKMALEYPEVVQNLILINCAGFADTIDVFGKVMRRYQIAQMISKTLLSPKRINKNIEKFLRGGFYNSKMSMKEEFIDYFYETVETSHFLLLLSRLFYFWDLFILKDVLPDLHCRTLIVWGAQDKIMPLQKSARNFSIIPHVDIRVAQKAGHVPPLEVSEWCNRVVVNYLKTQ